jgi:hypothetical protein
MISPSAADSIGFSGGLYTGLRSGFGSIQGMGLHVTIPASPVELDFGNTPVLAEPAARSMLAVLPAAALSQLLSAVRSWAISGGVTSVRVFPFQDPEGSDAWEVVLELRVDADAPEGQRRWKAIASVVDRVKSQLDARERCLLDSHLGIHLVWEDEP